MDASDTSAEAHAAQIAACRRMGPRGRTDAMFRLNELTRGTAASGIRRRHPEYTEAQVRQALLG